MLLALALFTKQQTLPYLLACLIWGAGRFKQGIKPLLAMAAGVLGLCALVAGGLEWATGGYFLRDVALYPVLMGRAASVSTPEFLITRSLAVWNIYWPIILLFAAAAVRALYRKEWSFPIILALVNAVFMLKLLASWGADINYAFGFVLAAMVAVAGVLDRLAKGSPYGVPAVLLLLVVLTPATPWQAWPHWPDAHTPAVTAHREQAAALAGLSGSILANTEGGHLFLGDATGRRVTFFDGIETQLFESTGLWKSRDSALVDAIRQRRFNALVLYGDFLPQGVRDAVARCYDRAKTVDHYGVYFPKSATGIAWADTTLTAWSSAGLMVTELDVATLNSETEGFAPLDRNQPGVLALKAETSGQNSRVEAMFSLRLDPKDATAGAHWSVLDASGREVASGSTTETGLAAREVTAPLDGEAFELRITLSGNAWIVPVNDDLVALYTYP